MSNFLNNRIMTNKLFACLALFTIPAICANAQQACSAKKKIELLFDSAGHVISFPPTVIRKSKKICPTVAIPASYFYKQIARYREMLSKTYNTLNESHTNEAYRCFFKT